MQNSFFKATTGILSLARAGVKGILGDDNRSVIVQIIDELVSGKYDNPLLRPARWCC